MSQEAAVCEEERLNTLHSYAILDSLPESAFDDIVKLATHICDAPVGMITFIDKDRQWFKSRVGIDFEETPRATALCAQALSSNKLCLVPDTTQDDRFNTNPFVTGEANVRFYAGMPLVSANGSPLGTLCIIDRVPRSLDTRQQNALVALARQIMTQLELRKIIADQENKRFRMLAETLPQLVWRSLPDGQCDYVSKQWTTYTGYSEPELISHGWLDLTVHPDDRERTLEEWRGAISGQHDYNVDYRIRAKDTTYRWFKTRAAAMRDDKGDIVYWYGTCTDIEDIVQAREVLARSRQELEDQVQERTAELAEEKCRAENATKSKSQFLATMSHEIRTPMNGILGFAELLRDTQLSETQLRYTTLMQEAGKSLLAIINDILDISKIEAGKIELEDIELSPSSLVDGAISILRSQTQLKPVTLIGTVAPDVPDWVLGDPTRLRQVLLNLLSNAVKFTEEGRVKLEVSMRDCGKQLRFSVTDTGIGIPEDRQQNLFQPFSQIDRSVSRNYGGTGLGLAISKRLVEAMGGKLWLEKSSGEGSTFVFTIGLRACSRPIEYSVSIVNKSPCVPLDILVAEDLEMNRIIIQQILLNAGYRVTLVNNGMEAVEAMNSSTFDLILMDMEMPVMGGLEATRLIRKMTNISADFPIIALTANALREDVEKAKNFGITMHLSKPIERVRLLDVLASYSSRKLAAEDAGGSLPHDILDRGALGELREQMGDMIEHILDMSVSEIAGCLKAISGATATIEIHEQSHVLVSLAGNVGMTALTRLSREVMNEAELGGSSKLQLLHEVGDASLQALRSFRQEDENLIC